MTPKQRVMTAIRRGVPDRVPWLEGSVDESLQLKLMNGRTDFTHGDLCRRLGMDGFGWSVPAGGKARASQDASASPQIAKQSFYRPPSVTFDFMPPWIAEMGRDANTGRMFVKKGLLTGRDKLALFEAYLPDPHHPARYEAVARWIEQYREDFAVFARIRLGSASTIESMGLDVFSIMLFEEPDLVKEIHRRFSEWSAAVVEHLNKMDFDFYWAFDDVADTKAPWVSPDMYEEFLKPYQEIVAGAMNKPWIYPQRRQHRTDARPHPAPGHERDASGPALGDGHRQIETRVRQPGVHRRQHRPRLHPYTWHAGRGGRRGERTNRAGRPAAAATS